MLYKNQKIIINNFREKSKATLTFYDKSEKVVETEAFIGKNGMTDNKIEGDGKTPLGEYKLGIVLGTHCRNELALLDKDILYIKITENLYWVNHIKSKYYNQLVDINMVKKDWKSAEHLIQYPKQYEYAIEIKTNPKNIAGKRKCNLFTL